MLGVIIGRSGYALLVLADMGVSMSRVVVISSSKSSFANPSRGSICRGLTSPTSGAPLEKPSKGLKGGSGEPISRSVSLPQLEAELEKTECALCASQFSAIAGNGGVGEPDKMEDPELEFCRNACSLS